MSDDEYEFDDMDSLVALLGDDEDLNPYHDDSRSSVVKKYPPPSQNGSSQKSSQKSSAELSPNESSSNDRRSPQARRSSQSATSTLPCRRSSSQASSHGQSSSQGQESSQGQGSSQCEMSSGSEETDKIKSKDELIDELNQMREQIKLLQSQQSSAGDGSQANQPRETFSDAISVPVEVKVVTKKKPVPADRTTPRERRRYSAEEAGSLAGLTEKPTLSNPDDDGWFEDDEEEESKEQGTLLESKSALFSKNNKRVAHTPKNTARRPDKVSPYKCELCLEVLDTLDALKFHMFQHRKESPQVCAVCGMSFPTKLKLEAHARTHKSSATSSTSNSVKMPSASRPSGATQRGQREKEGGGGQSSGSARRETEAVELNRHSQIRILNPLVSSARLDSMMEGRKMLRLSILQKYLSTGSNEGDWVTMGVIVSKLPPKTSSKGKTFSIWKLSDLTTCDQTVTLFLFGKAHDDHWKVAQGSVIGLLNASVLPPKDNGQDEGVSLSVDHPEKLLLLGKSKDFGHCRGRRKDGKNCSMVVNMAVSEFCQYHVQTEYKKHSAKRADLQSSYGGAQPNAYKKKLGSNIIYGGHSYNPVSASVVGSVAGKPGAKTKRKESKMGLESLGVTGAKGLEQGARDEVLTLHGKQNNEDTLVKVSGANKHFKEMLSTPCLGSQNLIRHMVKVEEVTKPISTISAKDLIKQHQQNMKAKHAARLNGHKAASSSSSTSTLSKAPLKDRNGGGASKNTGTERASQSSHENQMPVLGRGLQGDDDIVFDVSSPSQTLGAMWKSNALPKRERGKSQSLEEAKRSAIAFVKAQGKLAKADPNQVGRRSKGPVSPRKREAVKRRVEEDLNRSTEEGDGDSDTHQPAKKQKMSFLGQEVSMSQDEMQTILEAKSSNSGLLAEVQSEMEELYFQQLEKKERLENQMASIKEKTVNVVSCKQCDYTWFAPSKLCTSENHPFTRHEATMRYYKCKKCTSRCITFNRIPNKSCRSCGGTDFERASMLKERKGPVLDSERLLIRGEERKWVM